MRRTSGQAGAASSQAQETLIFMHLPRTGGRTLASIIRRQYPKHQLYEAYGSPALPFATCSQQEREQFRAIVGHSNPGLHELVPGPSASITLLRDPVERAISAYYFVLNKSSHRLHETIRESGLDFAGVLRGGLLPTLDNNQTRRLSMTDITTVPYGECTREMLEQAKHCLDSHFEIVGTTERFDETLLMLKERFDWKGVFYAQRNRAPKRPRRDQVPAETLKLIREYNWLDIQLHRHVTECFERRLAELGASFRQRVSLFKLTNAAVSWRGSQVIPSYLKRARAHSSMTAEAPDVDD